MPSVVEFCYPGRFERHTFLHQLDRSGVRLRCDMAGIVPHVRGLKTKIGIHIALILLVSAVLTDVLVMFIAQGVLIRSELANRQKWVETVGRLRLSLSPSPTGDSDPDGGDPTVRDSLDKFGAALWVDAAGTLLLQLGHGGDELPQLRKAAEEAMRSRQVQQLDRGLRWAVVWWHAEAAIIAVPFMDADGQVLGAGAVLVPLAPVYSRLTRYHQPILLYILFNTSVLTLAGLYRLFRIYLRPIDHLVQQADAYDEDEDILFAFRREDNELNRLSNALNRMLERIRTDREKLKESVDLLASANTDLRQAQDEIVRAEKMATVGRLASGIAHEIGNPIGIVLGYLDLLKQPDLAPAEREDFLHRSEKEVQRVNSTIRQLLDMARPRPVQLCCLCVHAVIEDFVATLCGRSIFSQITLSTRLEASQDRVWADEDQLRQVLLNVVINAADAIHEYRPDGGGAITIMSADEAPAGLIIGVQDNGAGIPAEQLPNIFDPFFTTKEPGQGTGLGLAVSYILVKKMGGTMAAQSTPGQGTTVTFHLPLSSEKEPRL